MAKEDNLTPFTPDNAAENGSKGGKAKAGSKHLSTIIRELADNIDWNKTTLTNKAELKERFGKNGFKAMCYVALTKAISGDVRAMDWLAKYGYGTKIDITSNDETIKAATIVDLGNLNVTDISETEPNSSDN